MRGTGERGKEWKACKSTRLQAGCRDTAGPQGGSYPFSPLVAALLRGHANEVHAVKSGMPRAALVSAESVDPFTFPRGLRINRGVLREAWECME